MRRSLHALGFWLWLLALPGIAFAQKESIKGSDSGGKSSITDDNPKSSVSNSSASSSNSDRSDRSDSHSSYSSGSDNSSSHSSGSSSSYESGNSSSSWSSSSSDSDADSKPRRSESRSDRNNSDRDNSGSSNFSSGGWPSYSSPKPAYSEPEPAADPRPDYSHSSYEDGHPTQSAPVKGGTPTSGQPGNSGAAEQAVDGRNVVFDAPGPNALNALDKPLPGIRPDPLPAPPGGWSTEPTGSGPHGTLDAEGVDSLPTGQFGGTILSAPPRPNFSRDTTFNNPATILPGRPKGSLASPKPHPQVHNHVCGSDPYSHYANLGFYFSFSLGGGGFSSSGFSFVAPELACIYNTADELEALYLTPDWCTPDFMQQYDILLADFKHCYNALPVNLEQPWMWPALLTYDEERRFWAEECVNGNLDLWAIRDFLRAKAAYIPYLMPSVDASKAQDWTYVDTAFAAPMGGYNYYRTMKAYEPELVLDQLQKWAFKYEFIRIWPSYERLGDFHRNFFRSGFWALLRNKVKKDMEEAWMVVNSFEDQGYAYAENAGWLCAAMLSVEPKDKEMIAMRTQIKTFLKSRPARWQNHPLAPILD